MVEQARQEDGQEEFFAYDNLRKKKKCRYMNGLHSNPVMMIQDSSLSSSSSRPQQKTCVSLSLPCKCKTVL